jgi:RNA polymerase sigma-70 factor (ECF subfamily)
MRTVDDTPDTLIPTRQSLLGRLKRWDDQESWREFFNTYWKIIYRAAVRCGLSDAEAQDVVQETVITVAKKMEEFTYDPAKDSFKGWLLWLTRKKIALQFRRRERERTGPRGDSAGGGSPSEIESIPDPAESALEALWDAEWEENLTQAALARVKAQVSPKQFQVFSFSVLKGWPVAEVKRALDVSAAQVYLARHRVGALLKKELQRLERSLE